MVLSSTNDPVKADDKEPVRESASKQAAAPKKEDRDDMTEEDRKLQDDLDLLVQRLQESNTDLYLSSLELMKTLIRASTTSMTSVPKPLKYMRTHYDTMKEIHRKMPEGKWKSVTADIISVLAMCSDHDSDCLDYHLQGLGEPIEDWGHEYVRHLSLEIGEQWKSTAQKEHILKSVEEIIKYDLKHYTEGEACDRLIKFVSALPRMVRRDACPRDRSILYLLPLMAYSFLRRLVELSTPNEYAELEGLIPIGVKHPFQSEHPPVRTIQQLIDSVEVLLTFESMETGMWEENQFYELAQFCSAEFLSADRLDEVLSQMTIPRCRHLTFYSVELCEMSLSWLDAFSLNSFTIAGQAACSLDYPSVFAFLYDIPRVMLRSAIPGSVSEAMEAHPLRNMQYLEVQHMSWIDGLILRNFYNDQNTDFACHLDFCSPPITPLQAANLLNGLEEYFSTTVQSSQSLTIALPSQTVRMWPKQHSVPECFKKAKSVMQVDDREPARESASKQAPKKEDRDDMTEEDRKLPNDQNFLIQRLQESNTDLYLSSLELMKTLIRASTTSMTSVPKPLKYMRTHYDTMKEIHRKMPEGKWKSVTADIISVLAMCSDHDSDCLEYHLQGLGEPIEDWGHEYVRHLSLEIGEQWKSTTQKEHILKSVEVIIKYDLKHSAEGEACDLLVEIEQVHLLTNWIAKDEVDRACLYLLSIAPLSPDPVNSNIVRTVRDIYSKFGRQFEALRCSVMLNERETIKDYFTSNDELLWKQMAIFLGRHQIFLDEATTDVPEGVSDLNYNTSVSKFFRGLANELEIMEPKTPEGIYKTHLEQSRPFGTGINNDNSRMHIAASFVNGLVNCGFGVDKIVTDPDTANRFFYKNRDMGVFTAVASLGLIHRWDVEGGMGQCDTYLYHTDEYVRAGALLAIGIISAGVQDPCDPASALLVDNVHSERHCVRIGSILGLGFAYANSKRQTVIRDESGGVIYELKRVLTDSSTTANAEIKGISGLSLGLIRVGTADPEVANDLLAMLMERTEVDLQNHNWDFAALGIALVFLGTEAKSEVIVESCRAFPEPFGSMVATLIDVCAYAGTGNVLKIQNLLYICSEHFEPEETTTKKGKRDPNNTRAEFSLQQAVAVLGIGLIAMGEEIGSQMAHLMFNHLMRYGEPGIRRAVPLGLALLSVSNPQLSVLETLSKYSHDSDPETAHNVIFALGLVGAGTNNDRLVAMLRQLATYHHKDATSLMLVRLAQGLTQLGKGTMTLNPFHSDRQIASPVSVGALFAVCFAFLSGNSFILSNQQNYLIYTLSLAIQPRMLITLVEDVDAPETDTGNRLKQINVPVRVGQAVDTVAQAGKPKTITGFQTHTTPVLLAHGERAELATDEYVALTPYLEGLVILRKNPDAVSA